MAVSAGIGGAAERVVVEVPDQITADEEVQIAVAIVVEEAGAGGPAAAGDAGLFSDVGEGAVAVVAEQRVAAEIGDVEVWIAVVVIVAGGHAHAVVAVLHAGLFGDISEGAVAVVAVEAVPEPGIGLVGRGAGGHGILQAGPIDEIDVEPAVAVEVEQRDAADHGFDQVLLRGRVAIAKESDAGGSSDVAKHGQAIACRGPRGCSGRSQRDDDKAPPAHRDTIFDSQGSKRGRMACGAADPCTAMGGGSTRRAVRAAGHFRSSAASAPGPRRWRA